MVKFLFLDHRQFERVDGFTRRLEPPHKHGDPLFTSVQQPWYKDHLQLYGSVIRRPDGLFQIVQRYWDFELPSCRPMKWFQR